ncbi:Hypothetical predicted protein [Octopus vulgaris]|uniref:Uncharacterized protein n=1 Tax=Octopus vulgaris TaxID=6645 RepID=A0AA36B9Z3_OCTVU|nr:Hypothetical predicted protein [Octopus vulgaris]
MTPSGLVIKLLGLKPFLKWTPLYVYELHFRFESQVSSAQLKSRTPVLSLRGGCCASYGGSFGGCGDSTCSDGIGSCTGGIEGSDTGIGRCITGINSCNEESSDWMNVEDFLGLVKSGRCGILLTFILRIWEEIV